MKFNTLLTLFWLCTECEALINSLVFVHTIFRHGDRTPEKNNLYQASPYYNESFFKPYGFGQLINKGKLTEYNVGKALRERYSGFLDEDYNIKLIDARSSDFNRTKASLQAMLAGLFPPTKDLVWLEGLNWQPIPFTYVDRNYDKELYFFGCPNWNINFNEYLSKEGKPLVDRYIDTFQYITEKTGENYNDLLKVYYLYFGFEILGELKYALPEWATSVYPYPMKNTATMFYKSLVASKNLRQMSAGYLLKQILHDTQEKIDGKIPEKKMSIWCGHENNIASLLQILNVWDDEEFPSYGSYILLELHYIDGTYGFKIYYQNNNTTEPVLLRIPNCEEFCPLDKFNSLVEQDIPVNEEVCGRVSSAARKLAGNNWILFILLITYCMKM